VLRWPACRGARRGHGARHRGAVSAGHRAELRSARAHPERPGRCVPAGPFLPLESAGGLHLSPACASCAGTAAPVVYLLNDQHTCCPACQFYSPAARLCITVDACLADAHAAGVDADAAAAAPPPPPAGAAPAAQPAYVQSLAGALADAPFIRVAAAPAAALAPAAGAARGPVAPAPAPAPALAPALPSSPAPAGQPQPGPVQPPSSVGGQPPAAEQHLGSRSAPAPAPVQASMGWPAPGPRAEVDSGWHLTVAPASAPAHGPELPVSAAARAPGAPDEAAPAPSLAPPLAARRGATAPAVPDLAAPAGPPPGAGAPLGAALRPLQAGYGGTVPLGGPPGGSAPASLGPAPARATVAAVPADTRGGGINVRISLPAAHWGRYAGPVLAAVAAAPQVAALEDAAGADAPGLRHP